MSQKCIIHTATRVIRRVTTDEVPKVSSDETFVDMGDSKVDLAGGPWKVEADDKTIIKATAQEADQAFTSPQPTVLVELLQALTAMEGDLTIPQKLRTLATKMKAFFDQKTRID